MKSPADILISPIITEKSNAAKENSIYTFKVATDANKIEIKNAIEAIFSVDVLKVRTVTVPPKKKRVGKYTGYRPAWKKAIATLVQDQKITAFEV